MSLDRAIHATASTDTRASSETATALQIPTLIIDTVCIIGPTPGGPGGQPLKPTQGLGHSLRKSSLPRPSIDPSLAPRSLRCCGELELAALLRALCSRPSSHPLNYTIQKLSTEPGRNIPQKLINRPHPITRPTKWHRLFPGKAFVTFQD